MSCNATEIPDLSRYAARRMVRLLPVFVANADRYRLPLALVLAVARVESNFSNTAISRVGAIGTMQIMPSTAEGISKILKGTDVWKQTDNIRMGVYYLEWLYRKFGKFDLAIAAYNCGPGYVAKNGIGVCRGYLEAVLSWWAKMEVLTSCGGDIYAEGDGGGPTSPLPSPTYPRPSRPSRPPQRPPSPAAQAPGGSSAVFLILAALALGGGTKWLA